jgi:type IV pilus assembly protein PilV
MKTPRGFSLLEVLVAVIVLAIGLLGIARLQTQALKTNVSASQRSQAVMLAYYMMDAMRVNRDNAIAGAYNTGSASNPTCTKPPQGTTLAKNDLHHWFTQLKENLGDTDTTCASIACDANGVCTVRIQWDDSRAGGATNQSIEITSRL